VASQVAVSLLLLIGAALFIRTLSNLTSVDVGFRTTNLISFKLDPVRNGYAAERTRQLSKAVLAQLGTVPGVESVGFSTIRILDSNRWGSSISVEGRGPRDEDALFNAISPGYFHTLGIPIVEGRDFGDRDEYILKPGEDQQDFHVAIVNERFVRQHFGSASPIGRHVGFGNDPGAKMPMEIVGVVKDSKYVDVRSDAPAQLFVPYLEEADPSEFVVYVRTHSDPASAFGSVRRVVQQLDADLPVSDLRTVETQVAQSLSNERLMATMSSVFGILATALAIVGLYGVMAYTVARRTREFGIRIALGARALDVGWLVMRETLTIAVVGAAAGLPAAWWLSRYVESQLFGVAPVDARSLTLAVVAIAIAAVAAGVAPTRRAVSVEPMRALRYE
jgi:predicted permease